MFQRPVISVLIFFAVFQASGVAVGQLSMEAVKELFAAREQQMQEFSVELAIRTEFRESSEGPPPWPMGTRTGTYQFAYSFGKMRMSGDWKDGSDSSSHHVEAEFDGAASTRVRSGGGAAFGDLSPEATSCYPDGTFPQDYAVTVQGRPLTVTLDHLAIISESAGSDLLLESGANASGGLGQEIKLQVELDASRGHALRRAATLMRAVGTDNDWIVNAEYLVTSWFAEQDGIWLPESATFRHVSWENTDVAGGVQKTHLVTGKELQFSSWKLGRVSFDKLTIPDGALVEDRVNGGRFVARNVTDQEVSDATSPSAGSGSGIARTMLVVFTGVMVLVVAGLWLYRKR